MSDVIVSVAALGNGADTVAAIVGGPDRASSPHDHRSDHMIARTTSRRLENVLAMSATPRPATSTAPFPFPSAATITSPIARGRAA